MASKPKELKSSLFSAIAWLFAGFMLRKPKKMICLLPIHAKRNTGFKANASDREKFLRTLNKSSKQNVSNNLFH
jgi:hypothetical protein